MEPREGGDPEAMVPAPSDARALVPQGERAVRAPRRRPAADARAVTAPMKVALAAGAAIFATGTLVQIIAIAWLALAVAFAAGAGTVLANTGGLDTSTFRACTIAAIILDAVLVLGILSAWAAQVTSEDRPPPSHGVYVRHPVAVTGTGLLVALAAVTAGGWEPSVYFPYPLATVIVLANVYFWALVAMIATGRVVDAIWSPMKAWAQANAYRVGALTATLVLLGAAGHAAREVRWYRTPAKRAVAAIGLAPLGKLHGPIDAQEQLLCVAANETAPGEVGDEAGCRFLPGGGAGPTDDCFTTLAPDFPVVRDRLMWKFRLNVFDAEDVAMEALIVTCTKEPPPDDIHAYFSAVARNQSPKTARAARLSVQCDDNFDAARAVLRGCATTSLSAEDRQRNLAVLWESARCKLTDQEANVLESRLVDDLSFREVGERWQMSEAKAKDTFHNAIKRLRRLFPSMCLPDFLEE